MLFCKQTVRQKMQFFPSYSVGELHRCLLMDCNVCEVMKSIFSSLKLSETPYSNETGWQSLIIQTGVFLERCFECLHIVYCCF